MPFPRRKLWLILLVTFLFGTVLAVTLLGRVIMTSAPDQLSNGMTEQQVHALFGRPPDERFDAGFSAIASYEQWVANDGMIGVEFSDFIVSGWKVEKENVVIWQVKRMFKKFGR